MMKEPLLSIVVPHYGTPELLARCVTSVPEREDVQLIVVEDVDRRGAGWARNHGMEMATGRWLTFLDADDMLPSDFGRILDLLKDRDEDILFFRNKAVMSDKLDEPSKRENYEQCFKRYFDSGDESSLRYQMCSLWGKFFRHGFIMENNIRCDELKWSNDTFFSLKAGYAAAKIAVFHDVAYILTEHKGSLTAGKCFSMEEWSARYDVLLRKKRYLMERGQPEWADEYQWHLKNLLFIDWRTFVKEMNKLRGTGYFLPSVSKIARLSLLSIRSEIVSWILKK